jgi:hypothetical protein
MRERAREVTRNEFTTTGDDELGVNDGASCEDVLNNFHVP